MERDFREIRKVDQYTLLGVVEPSPENCSIFELPS
jgi:hypothetical protein